MESFTENKISEYNRDHFHQKKTAMEQSSHFKTYPLLPNFSESDQINENSQMKIDQMIGQFLPKNDLNYEATRYYIQSLIR